MPVGVAPGGVAPGGAAPATAAHVDVAKVIAHQRALRRCRVCPDMIGPVVVGEPATRPVMQIGQAPGIHEGRVGKPFGWSAGKTLFKWYTSIGMDEQRFREHVYMAAVCRCFPGKNPNGGDRLPNAAEVERCRHWLDAEMEMLKPRLVIPVGKLAMALFLEFGKLTEVVGRCIPIDTVAGKADCIALPHPSGLSTWHRTEPGKTLLDKSLQLIARHPEFKALTRPLG